MPFLLCCKLIAIAFLSLMQVYVFLLCAQLVDVDISLLGYLTAAPAVFLIAFFLGALGLLLSSLIKQLENFAGVMNFVIFPMFFLSSALYPLWKMQEASIWLYRLCQYNPFTYCIELLRFALFGQLNLGAFSVVLGATVITAVLALISFSPKFSQQR
jgi:ABC-2 type transport system permease protein